MNLQRLTQQLKHEAAAHPIKAGALAIGLALAVWFWIPLVAKMFGGEEPPGPAASKPTKAAVAKSMKKSATTKHAANRKGPASSSTKRKGAETPWPQLLEWMATDPRMTTATRLVNEHDPFQSLVKPMPKTAPQDAEDEAGSRLAERFLVTPENIGLELTSTLVGEKRSVAMISGKSYRLTRTASGLECEPPYIKIQRNDQEIRLKLAAVHAKSVILEVDGRRMRLKLAKVKTDEAVTITAVSPGN